MAKKPETQFRQGQVIPFLKTLKNTSYFAIQQLAIQGTPDFFLCVLGDFVALELKSPKGKLSKLQLYTLLNVTKTGGTSIVASPDNWEEVKKQLTDMDQGGYQS